MIGIPVATARANMAEPPPPQTVHRGSRLGEPAGGLRSVSIEHETLRMDLRPLADAKQAIVEAVYRVRNDGPARTLDLLFVSDGLARGTTSVAIDGRRVPATPGAAAALPANWQPPAETPDPSDSAGTLPYEPRSQGTLAFRITLPAGRHEVRVRYPAEATTYSRRELTPIWQLGYVLAPARDWAGFGTLDVRVELPRGWKARSSIPLRRSGNVLAGTFRGVPADALALSVQKPEPPAWPWYLLWAVLVAAGLALCGWAAWRLGTALGRRGKSSAWALPASVGMVLLWAIASALAYAAVPSIVEWQAGPFVNDYEIRALGYGAVFVLMMLLVVLIPLGIIILQLAAFFGRRRTISRSPAP